MSKTMELKWINKPKPKPLTKTPSPLSPPPPQQPSSIPIYISTKHSHVHPDHLRRLYASCNLSGNRFPADPDSIDTRKLRTALRRSAFVVSVFGKRADEAPPPGFEGLLQSVVDPVGPSNGDLVGFGRAVSDLGLTAAIYDVMVVPSLRGMGIGRLIVQKIVRMLTNRDIYDIAALCSEDERPFFEACGFQDDVLGSTTMMYTRSVSATSEANHQIAKRAGRKLLLLPPLRLPNS